MMKAGKIPVMIILLMSFSMLHGVGKPGTVIYLFPGQGADCRQFMDLEFPEGYDTVHMSYPVPDHRETLPEFAGRFLQSIDTSRNFILLGVSLGGMICTELSDLVNANRVILISSAKNRNELPSSYTFQKKVAINRCVPKRLTKAGALLLQGIVEPDRKYNKPLFKDMLKRKDPLYLKRTVDMIVHWDREEANPDIIHIHGNNDHTIPYKNVSCDYTIEDGSHMMVLTKSKEINAIIAEILGT